MNKTGWIIYNGSLSGDKFIDFAEMLYKAAVDRNHTAKIIKNNELSTMLTKDSLTIEAETDVELPDYVIFTDKDLYLARQLELLGVPVFNSAKTIEISDDKITTYQYLAKEKLPIPKTIVAPKVFVRNNNISNYINLNQIVETLGMPIIVKEAFGSFGEQVYLIETMEELREKVDQLYGKAFMFQEFISSSYGTDLRLQVVGDEVVAAMKRTSNDDFRANITAGATMEAYTPTEEEISLAVRAAKAIGADFSGVDLLFGPDNKPIICEINSNAHIRNLLDATGINAADFMISYAERVINGGLIRE
ncbi:ATP-grasp domain-containing protein [Ornithinibacillus halophilus]|uniref:SSU ribosomal protein S6P modification protein n=1 Tax=Ornithinibacillus halophilus TaxID=930117 RepID=A0A1M5DDE5_9BACI|nr:RimK family alpha-L-glutamate ligase [Ornithinibacillus halophilus]SHF65108.1 SSU ribosomal protein S6P modification protein [Ornithinibacillus halophilus]